MQSHSIENQKIDLKTQEAKRKTHRPPPFKKQESKAKLPKNLQQETFTALKEMLAQQKTESEMGAAHSLFALELAAETTNRIEKLAPSAQVMQLFNKLVDSMTHLNQKGIQETTFFLDGQAFNSSIFQGAKITITEYNTAPKSFNIEFSTNTEALNFFETHAPDLLNALQRGHFGFTVHRLDTSLLAEDEKHALPRVTRDLEKEDDQT